MGKIDKALKFSNLKKAYYFLKKNGVSRTFYACLERLDSNGDSYEKTTPSASELDWQKSHVWKQPILFSILVPAFDTPEAYFREMIQSVRSQTYGNWELVIADASPHQRLRAAADSYGDKRIHYLSLEKNGGISENTNAALEYANGDYIGLLDHDDVLEPDALFEMMTAIENRAQENQSGPEILYSDEDKANGTLTEFYEPNRKGKFNLDLILTNNYICHFLVMKAECIKSLGFRSEYDGAQDYDLILRGVSRFLKQEEKIVHISKILYHWRCHSGSTAENPGSKMYAYEAGRRAVEDFCNSQGWSADVLHSEHLGFYKIRYKEDILKVRKDLAAAGGRIISQGKLVGGAYAKDGHVLYEGLNCHFGGYMNRAVLQQDVYALDFRNIKIRKELKPEVREILKNAPDLKAAALKFGELAEQKGYRLLWNPMYQGNNLESDE